MARPSPPPCVVFVLGFRVFNKFSHFRPQKQKKHPKAGQVLVLGSPASSHACAPSEDGLFGSFPQAAASSLSLCLLMTPGLHPRVTVAGSLTLLQQCVRSSIGIGGRLPCSRSSTRGLLLATALSPREGGREGALSLPRRTSWRLPNAHSFVACVEKGAVVRAVSFPRSAGNGECRVDVWGSAPSARFWVCPN